jgi:hypothetical protein
VLSDTIQPFPNFSGIYDTAVKELPMKIVGKSASQANGRADGEPAGMIRSVAR